MENLLHLQHSPLAVDLLNEADLMELNAPFSKLRGQYRLAVLTLYQVANSSETSFTTRCLEPMVHQGCQVDIVS